ncbi:MAG: DAK2 domain-containing protein [Caldilineaceae bacterium]|nr:DAK2 domain-containing protein [Caldilineaceae bacterium]
MTQEFETQSPADIDNPYHEEIDHVGPATAQNGHQAEEDAPLTADENPVFTLDGQLLRQSFESALHWLEEHAAMINSLNVFPVPDGDTGTNMLMTLRSAIKHAALQTSQSAAETAQHLALGAIKGARGNSGVILSQILNGFARATEGKSSYTTADMAEALRRASESAYTAVMKPVEGTILTVIRAIAEAAEEAAGETSDIREQLNRTTAAARQALERTPDLLPILKEAGVVDSGGQGLVTIFEGMSRFLRGERGIAHPRLEGPASGPAAVVAEHKIHLENPPAPLADGRYGYDIQFLIRAEALDVEAIREKINSMGDCPLVIGTPELVKVHVHSLDPAPALGYGASLGMLDDIVVENMDLQFQSFAQKQEEAERAASIPKNLTTEALTGVGIIAVAAGEGLAEHFRSLGASAVVKGGQSMNPSTADFLEAIESVTAEAVILLPNNKNVIMAAQQARDLADRPVYVVPSRSAPQGFAALMAFDYSEDGEDNAESMTEAMHQVVTIEITRAVRTTNINNIAVQEGDCIGLLDGQLISRGDDDASVIRDILARIDLSSYEIVSIFYGDVCSEAQAVQLAANLEGVYPDLTFEVHAGDQPHYSYILAIE